MRPLWVEALPALCITCAGIQASLVSLVQSHLGAVVLATVTVATVTVTTVITVAAVIVATVTIPSIAAIVAVISIVTVVISIPALALIAPPIAVSILVISANTIAALALSLAIVSIISITAILRLRGRGGHRKYTESKHETYNRPADLCSKIILHISPLSLFTDDVSKVEAAGQIGSSTLIAMQLTRGEGSSSYS